MHPVGCQGTLRIFLACQDLNNPNVCNEFNCSAYLDGSGGEAYTSEGPVKVSHALPKTLHDIRPAILIRVRNFSATADLTAGGAPLKDRSGGY